MDKRLQLVYVTKELPSVAPSSNTSTTLATSYTKGMIEEIEGIPVLLVKYSYHHSARIGAYSSAIKSNSGEGVYSVISEESLETLKTKYDVWKSGGKVSLQDQMRIGVHCSAIYYISEKK